MISKAVEKVIIENWPPFQNAIRLRQIQAAVDGLRYVRGYTFDQIFEVFSRILKEAKIEEDLTKARFDECCREIDELPA